MSNLEILFSAILLVLVVMTIVLGCHLSAIEDKLQNISSHIYWLKEEDDE